jgi:hypothetical protein
VFDLVVQIVFQLRVLTRISPPKLERVNGIEKGAKHRTERGSAG